jgi:hypothetical protein
MARAPSRARTKNLLDGDYNVNKYLKEHYKARVRSNIPIENEKIPGIFNNGHDELFCCYKVYTFKTFKLTMRQSTKKAKSKMP